MKNLITCLVMCVLSSAALAETWIVDDNNPADFDNIQAAVDAASDGDEIIVMKGIYTSTDTSFPYSVVDISEKSLLLYSVHGPSETIISGEGNNIGITCFGPNSNITIEGFTITDCNQANHDGGGLYCIENSPTIINCNFIRNETDTKGGGMFFGLSCAPVIEDCIVTMNNSDDSGGGIYCKSGAMTLTNTTVCGNLPNQVSGDYTDGGGNNVCEYTNTWTVDDDGNADFDNIQAAVDASSQGDEIIVMPGTYTSIQDEPVVYVADRFLTIRSSDPSDPEIVAATIIDGEGVRRGIFYENTNVAFLDDPPEDVDPIAHDVIQQTTDYVDDNTPIIRIQRFGSERQDLRARSATVSYIPCLLTVDGITIVNGFKSGTDWQSSSGGGLYAKDGNLIVSNCSFSGNVARSGGAISFNTLYENHFRINNCSINNNSTYTKDNATEWGGGIFTDGGYLEITDCTLSENIAHTNAGAISCWDTHLTMINCTIQNNSVIDYEFEKSSDKWVGGIFIHEGNTVIEGCSFIGNKGLFGGALVTQLQSGNGESLVLEVNNCIFENNIAEGYSEYWGMDACGGAVVLNHYDYPGAETGAYFTNCEFINNSATIGGGVTLGMPPTEFYNASATLTGCVFKGNSAVSYGGGMWVAEKAVAEVYSTEVCGNTPNWITGPWINGGDNTIDLYCLDECPDINDDGVVNVIDLLIVLSYWDEIEGPADINLDGIVNVVDFLIVLSSWGPCE